MNSGAGTRNMLKHVEIHFSLHVTYHVSRVKNMSRSITLKFMLAFLLVSITGAALAAVFARQMAIAEFDRFVLDQAQRNFIIRATEYYQTRRSWAGADRFFHLPLKFPQSGTAPNMEPKPVPVFPVVDLNQVVVVQTGPFHIGEQIPEEGMAQGVPIEVDGQLVGTMLVAAPAPELDAREEHYLARTNQALFYGAVGAAGIALLLGVFLARTLTRPMRELTEAATAVARGDGEQCVPVRSQDELGELAASFNQMSADLTRANELRRQMTADIAHELRTPLTVLGGYIEAMRDGTLQPTSERLETMHAEVQHLIRLVGDLRTLSLADAGELPLDRVPVSPRDLLTRLASIYQQYAYQQQVDLSVDAPDSLPEIYIDPDRMLQVLGNLVSNALRYTPKGGEVSVQCSVFSQQLRKIRDRVGAETKLNTENWLLITVTDTGQGIAPESLPHVFERFYRGETSRQQQQGESGLGLAIAKSIVEMHGGSVQAQSEGQGKGSTFTIQLPLSS